MVAGRGEILRHVLEDIGAGVLDRRGFAVHQAVGPDDVAPEMLADRLAAQTDPEEGFFPREGLDHFQGDSGFGWRAGAGRNQHAIWIEGEGFLGGDLVVAKYALFHAQLTEVLDKVESK